MSLHRLAVNVPSHCDESSSDPSRRSAGRQPCPLQTEGKEESGRPSELYKVTEQGSPRIGIKTYVA